MHSSRRSHGVPGDGAFDDTPAVMVQTEELFKAAVWSMQEGFVLQDEHGAIRLCNPRAEQILGITAEQMIGRTSGDSQFHAVREDLTDFPLDEHPTVRSLKRGETVADVVMGVYKSDGELRWVTVNSTPLIFPGSPKPYAAVATFVDITERRLAEQALRDSEARFSEAQQIARIGSWDFDPSDERLTWSSEMYNIYGIDPNQGQPDHEMLQSRYHPADRAMRDALVADAVRCGRPFSFDARIVLDDGEIRWVHVIGQAVKDAQGMVVRLHGTTIDITERKAIEEEIRSYTLMLSSRNREIENAYAKLERANARLAALATEDAVTGLHNHRALQERLELEAGRARRYDESVSLVMVDVDHFKQFNDTFGHPEGDKVLRQVAEKLLSAIRATDMAARYGGEEFALVLPNTPADCAMSIAERAREIIEKAEWAKRNITVSLGVCTMCGPNADASAMIASADRAMYRSKHDGRNRVTLNIDAHGDAGPIVPERRSVFLEWMDSFAPVPSRLTPTRQGESVSAATSAMAGPAVRRPSGVKPRKRIR